MYDNEHQTNEHRSRGSGNISADGTYRYVRPESREMLYRDATVEPCEESPKPLPLPRRLPKLHPLPQICLLPPPPLCADSG